MEERSEKQQLKIGSTKDGLMASFTMNIVIIMILVSIICWLYSILSVHPKFQLVFSSDCVVY